MSTAAAALRRAPGWLLPAIPLAIGAALRFATITHQSFWYDEAFTPVHVLVPSLAQTLHHVVHTENTPPLWYLLAWAMARVAGTGELALRSISAVAGTAMIAVGWGLGRELAGRRAAFVTATFVAVNPLFVWYSQEARAYILFATLAAASLYWFLRAQRDATPRALAAWAVLSALALCTHYFAVFLLVPEALVLLAASRRRATLAAVGLVGVVGAALIPLIAAQGGHGTQWIGRWALSSRLETIPQYWLTGESAAPLGHGIEALVALVVAAAALAGARRLPQRAWLCVGIGAAAILIPVALALLGADYLAPRNLIAAWVPLTAALAAACVLGGRAGLALAAVLAAGWLALSVDVNLSPRLQRGNWRAVAAVLRADPPASRAIVTPELGAAPLEYYLAPLRPTHRAVSAEEIDLVGYPPLRRARAPQGYALFEHRVVDGLSVYRFRAVAVMPALPARELRRRAITDASPEVLTTAF